jgi:plasmid stabilization system protein ParE
MSYHLSLSELVEADLEQAFGWYESRQAGLGVRFIEAIEAKLDQIVANPYLFAVRYKEVRWGSVKGFPYVIHYRIEQELVQVTAIVSTEQDPEQWKERL